jgi:rRNA maturation RNase YbeY
MVTIDYIDVNEVPGVNPEFLFEWYSDVVKKYNSKLGDVSVIFCSDEHLLDMNKQYLEHDYYTDIITFDYTEGNTVSGDLFISVDRVADNANSLGVEFNNELHRVCVHGLLHLCGLGDKSHDEEIAMRKAEDSALELRLFHVKHLK